MPGAGQFPSTHHVEKRALDFMKEYPNQSLADPLPGLLRELIDEIKGLRADLRQEVLHREVAKLPTPIQNA